MAHPPTLGPCTCKRGQQRDNCPQCEGTGQRIDFAALRARNAAPPVSLRLYYTSGGRGAKWIKLEVYAIGPLGLYHVGSGKYQPGATPGVRREVERIAEDNGILDPNSTTHKIEEIDPTL